MFQKISIQFINNISYFGRAKRWFSIIYIAFLSGLPFLILMSLTNIPAPFDDIHLYRRPFSSFENQEEYIKQQFQFNELVKMGIEYNGDKITNIKSNNSIANDLIDILNDSIQLSYIKLEKHTNTVKTKGKGYILKNKFSYKKYNIYNQEKYLIANDFVKSINQRFMIPDNISGVIVILNNNQYLDINLPLLKLNNSSFLIYENNNLQFNNNIDEKTKQELIIYLEQIKKLIPKNVKKIIIGNKIVYGGFNSQCDIMHNKDAKIINYKYTHYTSLDVNHNKLEKYINDTYDQKNKLIKLIDIIYLLSNNKINIKDIEEFFDIIDIEYDVNIKYNCMLEINQPSLIYNYFYGDMIYIPTSITDIKSSSEPTLNIIQDWIDNQKKYFINIEMNKVYENI